MRTLAIVTYYKSTNGVEVDTIHITTNHPRFKTYLHPSKEDVFEAIAHDLFYQTIKNIFYNPELK